LKRATVVSIAVASATSDYDAGGIGVTGNHQPQTDQICTCPDDGYEVRRDEMDDAHPCREMAMFIEDLNRWCCCVNYEAQSVKKCTLKNVLLVAP